MRAELLAEPRLQTLRSYLTAPSMCAPIPDRSIAGEVSLGEISSIFYNSHYGSALGCNDLRYAQNHGYDPRELMSLEVGKNCDPWGHGFFVADCTYLCLGYEQRYGKLNIDTHQSSRVLVTATSHDWEEAIVPDIAYGQKTEADKIAAADAREITWEELYTNIFDKKFIRGIFSLISHEEDSVTHDMCQIPHHAADYLTSVIPVATKALEYLNRRNMQAIDVDPFLAPEDAAQRFDALASLAVVVSHRMKEKLQYYADKGYLSAAWILAGHAGIQQQIDEQLAPLVDPNHP